MEEPPTLTSHLLWEPPEAPVIIIRQCVCLHRNVRRISLIINLCSNKRHVGWRNDVPINLSGTDSIISSDRGFLNLNSGSSRGHYKSLTTRQSPTLLIYVCLRIKCCFNIGYLQKWYVTIKDVNHMTLNWETTEAQISMSALCVFRERASFFV